MRLPTSSAFLVIFLLSVVVHTGCAKSAHEPTIQMDGASKEGEANLVVLQGKERDEGAKLGAEQKPSVEQPRRIKYTADIKLIVDDFAQAEGRLKDILKEAKAFVAHAEINSSPGTIRNGVWRVRVPVNQMHSCRDALLKLGDVERNTLDSEDMTAQFFDLEAHLKNRMAEREAMRKLLEKTGERDMKQFLDVKRELDALSDDINRKESMLRLWANLTDLTTVNLTMREKQKYLADKQPAVAEVPTFGMRAGNTFQRSWEAFVGLVQQLSLIVVAAIPWSPLPALGAGLWLAARRLRRRQPPRPVAFDAAAPNP